FNSASNCFFASLTSSKRCLGMKPFIFSSAAATTSCTTSLDTPFSCKSSFNHSIFYPPFVHLRFLTRSRPVMSFVLRLKYQSGGKYNKRALFSPLACFDCPALSQRLFPCPFPSRLISWCVCVARSTLAPLEARFPVFLTAHDRHDSSLLYIALEPFSIRYVPRNIVHTSVTCDSLARINLIIKIRNNRTATIWVQRRKVD